MLSEALRLDRKSKYYWDEKRRWHQCEHFFQERKWKDTKLSCGWSKITFDQRKQHLNPINCRFVTQISGLFTRSLSHFLHSWIPAAGQHTLLYLSSPVKQSPDTNSPSHSHALPLREPFHHPAGIHHFPALTPTSLHCLVCTHRLQAVCLTPTHWCCRRHYVTWVNPEVKTAFLFFPPSSTFMPR